MSNNGAPIICPFTITVDTREQHSYTFSGLSDGVAERRRPIVVPTLRATLPNGDYSIFGLPQVAVERKSKSDLFGSVARRENFETRLQRMSELSYSVVIVEAELSEILTNPPRHSKFKPKALLRTIFAWDQRWPTSWLFLPGRDAAEAATFRILERFYKDRRELHKALTLDTSTALTSSTL